MFQILYSFSDILFNFFIINEFSNTQNNFSKNSNGNNINKNNISNINKSIAPYIINNKGINKYKIIPDKKKK